MRGAPRYLTIAVGLTLLVGPSMADAAVAEATVAAGSEAQSAVGSPPGEAGAEESPAEEQPAEEPVTAVPPVPGTGDGQLAETPVAAEIVDPGEADADADGDPVAEIEAPEPLLRTRPRTAARRDRDERLHSTRTERRGQPLSGYGSFRPRPGRCYAAVTDRARDGLCNGDLACEQAFDSSPCIADRDSQECLDYIVSRPCLDDASSFECALFNAARSSYCAVETNEFYCGGSGSTGAETFGPPGQPQTQLVGVFDRGVGGRLVLVDREPKKRSRPRLPMTGHEPGLPVAVALLALIAGAGLRRFAVPRP